MNIFVLDLDHTLCARYHHDKHLVKMQLESAQMLCTVCDFYGQTTPYRPTHKYHPCTEWVGHSLQNWIWLRDLAYALEEEWRFRYDKPYITHKSVDVIRSLSIPQHIPDIGLTPFAQAMPDKYKNPNPVIAYRNYYIGEKLSYKKKNGVFVMNSWKGSGMPTWVSIPLLKYFDSGNKDDLLNTGMEQQYANV